MALLETEIACNEMENKMTIDDTIDLNNPKTAREYIDQFEVPNAPSKPGFIILNTGKRIEFATMTDEEACVAAHLLHDLIIEAAKKAIKH